MGWEKRGHGEERTVEYGVCRYTIENNEFLRARSFVFVTATTELTAEHGGQREGGTTERPYLIYIVLRVKCEPVEQLQVKRQF